MPERIKETTDKLQKIYVLLFLQVFSCENLFPIDRAWKYTVDILASSHDMDEMIGVESTLPDSEFVKESLQGNYLASIR